MTLADLLTRTCVIAQRSAGNETDDYGDEIPEEETVEVLCELQQQQRSEGQDDLSDTRWLLLLPVGTDIATGDSVTVDGFVHEVIGDPWDARDPRGGAVLDHVEATLRRTSGSEDAS